MYLAFATVLQASAEEEMLLVPASDGIGMGTPTGPEKKEEEEKGRVPALYRVD